MPKFSAAAVSLLLLIAFSSLQAQTGAFPYTPSLNLKAMDTSVDACSDFYQYACGGWQKQNPIPPDQSSWDVYRKLYEDNLNYLRSILDESASPEAARDNVTREIGDFYAACM